MKRGINPLHDNVMDFAGAVKGRFWETHGRLRAGIGWNGRHWGWPRSDEFTGNWLASLSTTKAKPSALAQAMKHVEAVLKLIDPSFNLRPIAIRRRKPNPYFKRGTIFRYALDALREGGKPSYGSKPCWWRDGCAAKAVRTCSGRRKRPCGITGARSNRVRRNAPLRDGR